MFSRIILPDKAVVPKNIKTLFLHNSEENRPQTRVYQTITLSNRMTLFFVKSVVGMATDLTVNHANCAP